MRKVRICAVVVFLAGMAGSVWAIDLTKWKYCSVVTLENKVAEYYRADITPEIYNAAKPDLSDIRIIDSNGSQIPYLITRAYDIAERQEYSPKIINRSTDARKGSFVTLDFGGQTMKNSIKVVTGGNNFRRAVKVEGSNDNVRFFILVKQAFVFAITDKNWSQFSDVDLPLNDYRYLRITVTPMPDEKDNPSIQDVRAFKCENKPAGRMSVAMLCTNHIEDENENSSIYEYDLGLCNLPVSEIKLSIEDKSFYRHLTIEGRNVLKRRIKIAGEDNRERFEDVNESWYYLAGNAIYRYISADGKEQEKTTLPYSGAYRYLKVTIKNYDDRPLKIRSASAQMIGHKIVFSVEDNAKPVLLYVGSESANRPQYDIGHKIYKPLDVEAAPAILGNIAENPLFGKTEPKLIPWTEKHKSILLVIMAVVVLVLGLFIIKSFKSIKPAE
ncbi:MAG: DUF3999 family protein [Sedimentisphaerales bacterium]